MFFGQVLTAMITPFDESGKLSIPQTKLLAEHLDNNGTDAFVLSGTTGEGPTLTMEEKIELFQTVRFSSQKPIIANVGTNNTTETIENMKVFEANCDINGYLVVCPYYNKPSQEGLYMHFKTVAEATELPIIIYNIPGRTGITMTPETVAKLAKIPNISGIKESTGDIQSFTEILRLTQDLDFYVYSGDDYMTLPAIALGAHGVVSVSSHIIGKDMQNMIHYFKFGRTEEAAKLNQRMLPFFNGIFYKTNPIPVKETLNYLGFNVGGTRLPLYSEFTPENEEFIQHMLEQQNIFAK